MSEKTNKSFSKRLKITKTGKIMSRKPGVDHFNARASRVSQLGGRREVSFAMTNKARGRFLPNS